jgi:hypothetical protein
MAGAGPGSLVVRLPRRLRPFAPVGGGRGGGEDGAQPVAMS